MTTKKARKKQSADAAKPPPAKAPPNRPFAALAKKAAAKKADDDAPGKPSAGKPSAPTRTAPPRGATTASKSDDLVSFEAYMRGAPRIAGTSRRIPKTVSSIDEIPKSEVVDLDEPARSRLRALVDGALRFEVMDDGDVVEGRRLDVDPRELRRLRQQRYPIDGTLDLHGMSGEVARTNVDRFLTRRRSEGDRAVLVVHGKGKHSPGGSAVLRGEIGAWLSQGASAREVLAFASVPEQDGPSGAVMVLLAKR